MLNSAAHLSDDQFDALSDLLDAHAIFDIDGVLGLMHAVAVAPAMVLPSAWLPRILSNEATALDERTGRALLDMIMRLYNEVLDYLGHDGVVIPEADDVAGCESFAAGYVFGAELVPDWTTNEAHWSFAAPFAYLAGRLDLVPERLIADIEQYLEPDPKQSLRSQLGGLVLAANDSFEKYRRASAPSPRTPAARPRVGRNEPCPCGSGKKHKRCCAT